MANKTSSAQVQRLKSDEGFSSTVYTINGIPHIGYGFNKLVHTDLPEQMTRLQADAFLNQILTEIYEPIVNSKLTRPVNQNEFDALLSFVYNAGNADFDLWDSVNLKLRNTGPVWKSTAVTYHGQIVDGLVKRRTREFDLYSTTGEMNLLWIVALIGGAVLLFFYNKRSNDN